MAAKPDTSEEEIRTKLENVHLPDSLSSKDTSCILVLGMAGSGKTTFVQRLTAHLHAKSTPPYVINLDPAVYEVNYPVNIDIRDTVKYKEVMKQYNLGPNGGIMTCLNLFATKFEQVVGFIENRKSQHKHIIIDTPGQIEVFTWSASGMIITETLAMTHPTVIVYVMDTARCTNPVTFMSNMLYACSIMYKTKLPFIVLLNKVDIVDHSFVQEWMTDFEAFQDALQPGGSYASNLTLSMSLVLDQFYQNLHCVGVSSMTGFGMDDFLAKHDVAVNEFITEFRPELEKKIKRKQEEKNKKKSNSDINNGGSGVFSQPVDNAPFITPGGGPDGPQDVYDMDEDREMEEDTMFEKYMVGSNKDIIS